MSTLLTALTGRVQRLIGDIDTANPRHETSDYMNALSDSLEDFNADVRIGKEYEILGTGNSRYYNPDPTAFHKTLFVGFAALYVMMGEKFKAANEAVSYNNSAGSTNLTNVPKEMEASINTLKAKLDMAIDRELRYAVEEDMSITELTTQE